MNNIVLVFAVFSLFIFAAPYVYAEDVYIQIDELPSWADYAANVMYESTQAWQNANPGLTFYKVELHSDADFAVQWVKEFGVEHVGYAYGNQFIEVGLGDSNCGNQWNPYSERYISHIMKHEIGHIFGFEHDENDPDSIMYPIALNLEYGLVEEEYRLTEGYGQFVPFCTIKDVTSYEFSISTTDEIFGFEYYIVPSYAEFEKWVEGESFQYYSDSDCFGEGYLGFSGTCEGVSKNSGIIVIMDQELTTPLETITVQKLENPDIAHSKSYLSSKSSENRISAFGDEYEQPGVESEDRISAFGDEYEQPGVESESTSLVQENKIRELNQEIISLEFLIKQLEQENKQLEQDLSSENNSQKDFTLASFVDPKKDPQYYIDRYNNEADYKEWFNENYPSYLTIYEAVGKRQPVPDWIKTNAKWWSEGKISEDVFINGIKYLIEERIVNIDQDK